MTSSMSVDTLHDDMIHDVQLDYYGKRMATCSSDRTIKIFEIGPSTPTQTAELRGHEGPVWQVAWAHPKFGNMLASASYDRKVIIWKETTKNKWTIFYEYTGHRLSVNSIAWAPHEFGPMLAAGSSDGRISILVVKEGEEVISAISDAHSIGVNAVSWEPALGVLHAKPSTQAEPLVKRLVSGGCDNVVRIWKLLDDNLLLDKDDVVELRYHKDWVRDVAWAPNIGLPTSTIASCSQDGVLVIWAREEHSTFVRVHSTESKAENGPMWRVSWSLTGNILAVSSGDNKVSLWKESPDGKWKQISTLDQNGHITSSQ